MRLVLLIVVLLCASCRAPYLSEINDLTVMRYEIPPYGTPADELDLWFDQNAFAPGPQVLQAESELRRLPYTGLTYALEADRTWWYTRAQTSKDFCTTQKIVYYKLDQNNALARAILTSRSQCL